MTGKRAPFSVDAKAQRNFLRVWAEFLRRIPDARLIFDMTLYVDIATQAHYIECMTARRLDVSRVVLRRDANILGGLRDIDILSDCFLYSGGSLLFDALGTGTGTGTVAPVLVLAGRGLRGLSGTSLMSNLGLAGWMARSRIKCIDKANAFSA